MTNSYSTSGVNIDEGNRFVSLIKKLAKGTHTAEVIGNLGGFAGLFDISKFCITEPVLVACTDGVGTKLKIAAAAEIYNTVGIDLVAMSVNDLVVMGARPLFFLDYIATGVLKPEQMAEVVAGITEGCKISGAALLGGETAEMPGMYASGEFDIAGFAVGIVEKAKIINKERVKPGDVVIGLASSGFHSNGYSLIRKIFFEDKKFSVFDTLEGFGIIADFLLKPTKIYVNSVLAVLSEVEVHGMAHITGGGFYDNIVRSMPQGTMCVVEKTAISEPLAFSALRSLSNISERELYKVFNMGVGYVFIVSKSHESLLLNIAKECGEDVFTIGEIKEGEDIPVVKIKGIDL